MNNKINTTNLTVFFLLILVLLAEIYLLSFGIEISLDGVSYLWGAENIETGIGYFQKSKYQDALIPITNWPPFYSSVVAIFIYLFNIESTLAAKIVNFLISFIFYIAWFYFYKIYFSQTIVKNKNNSKIVFLFSLIWLVLGVNIWQFTASVGSDLLFITLIAFVAIFLQTSIISQSFKKQLFYAFLAGVFSGLAVLTRMIGLAFILSSIFTYLLFTKPSIKQGIYRLLLYTISSISFLLVWLLRNSNYEDKNQIASSLNANTINIFNLEKITDIISYFAIDTFNISSRLNLYSLFFLFFIIAILLITILKNKKSNLLKPSNVWLLLSIFIYVAIVTYSGITKGHNRSSGFMRYFFTIQPLIIPILFSLIIVLLQKKNYKYRITAIYVILFTAYSFSSGLNKNRVYFSSKTKQETNSELYLKINQYVQNEDLLLSNTSKFIGFHSKKQCLYVEHSDRIRLLLTDWWQKPYNNVYAAFSKQVGISYRLPYQTHFELTQNLPIKRIIYENNNYIFVELDKKTIFKDTKK